MKLSKIIKGFHNSQNGHVFITALIILVLGSAMLAPLLGFIGTGLKTGQAFEEQTDLLYAADAGIEDAIWQINNYGAGIVDGIKERETDEGEITGPGVSGYLPPYNMEEGGEIFTDYYNRVTYAPDSLSGINNCGVSISILWIPGGAFKVTSTSNQLNKDKTLSIISWILAQDNVGAYSDEYLYLFDNGITTPGTVDLKNKVSVLGGIMSGSEPTGNGEFGEDEIGDEEAWKQFDTDDNAWPDADFIRNMYEQQAIGGVNYTDIDTIDVGSGPGTYMLQSGISWDDLTIGGEKTTQLNGTLFVDGKLTFGPADMPLNLAGNTIYVTDDIEFKNGGGVDITGFGCIIAEGSIIFKVNTTTNPDDFIFLMSINGEVQINNDVNIYGCIAGNTTVELKAKCDLDARGFTEDMLDNFNFPSGGVIPDGIWEEVKLISWEVD